MKVTAEDQKFIDEAYAEMHDWENEVFEHNSKIINDCGDTAKEDFKSLMEYCDITDKIELVEKPDDSFKKIGHPEYHGVFKFTHINEWSVGQDGDSYCGFLYAQVIKTGQYLKIPYSI